MLVLEFVGPAKAQQQYKVAGGFMTFVSIVTITKIVIAAAASAVTSVSANTNVEANIGPPPSGYMKEQCKDGGWQELGFKNQGECVSYFASEGKAGGGE